MGGTWLVLNAGAREGDAVEKTEAALREHGVPVDARRFAGDPGEVQQALREAVGARPDRLLVGGGDGTLSAAAELLAGADTALGVLPLGTGNDFARNLHIPRDLGAACAVIAAGAVRRVTLGVANGRPFLNALSLGVSAAIARRLTPELKRRAGPLAYPLAAAGEALAPEAFALALDAGDGRRELEALQVVVGNGRYHGGGTLVAPRAAIDDDRLDVYVVEAGAPQGAPAEQARNAWVLARVALLLRRGRHLEHARVSHVRCREVAIEATPPQEVNADGEIRGTTPLRCGVWPGALRVLAPGGETAR